MEKDSTFIYLQTSSGELISYDLYPLDRVLYLRRLFSEDFTISENRIILFRNGKQLDDMEQLYTNDTIMIHITPQLNNYSNTIQSYKLIY